MDQNESGTYPPFISEQISPIGQDKIKGREIFIQDNSITAGTPHRGILKQNGHVICLIINK